MDELVPWMFRVAQALLQAIIEVLWLVLKLLESLSNKLYYLRVKLSRKQPSLFQWVNRLIEYVDERYVTEVSERFLALVDNGVDPRHAFRMITGLNND